MESADIQEELAINVNPEIIISVEVERLTALVDEIRLDFGRETTVVTDMFPNRTTWLPPSVCRIVVESFTIDGAKIRDNIAIGVFSFGRIIPVVILILRGIKNIA